MKEIRRARLRRQRFRAPHRALAPVPPVPQLGEPESIHRFQELYDIAPLGFFTLDRQGRITKVNAIGAKLLGFPADWLIGKAFVVFIARQDVCRFLDCLTDSLRNPEQRTLALDMFVGDRTVPVQISLVTVRVGPLALHRLTVVDSTDSRKTETLLRESVAGWYSLIHNAPDIIMTVDPSGRISFVNKPVWGYSANALIGTNVLDHVPEFEQPKVLRCMDHAFRYNKRSVCEIAGVNGQRNRWYQFSFGSQHATPPGLTTTTTTTTTTLLIQEISEHKRTEDMLRVSGEQLRDFAARLEAVREEERTRVAREIHDELGQALTILKLDLSWLQKESSRDRNAARKKLKGIIRQVDETIERVRRISSDLRPSILDNLGLIPAIEWQVSEFRKRTGIRTEIVSSAGGLNLPAEASAGVFRVVQEALTNVIRHANASRVRIHIKLGSRVLLISILDNGRGMTRQEETDLKSLGIVGMKERISRLGGDFNILSEPGKGTRLDIVIPVNHD